jgi:hypothetical protein
MGKLATLLVAAAISALGAADDAAIQNTFIKPWVEALRSKDKAKIERFFHPAMRSCMNPGTKEYFDNSFEGEAESGVSGPYRITKIERMKGLPPPFLPEEKFYYPVPPTYEVDIQFDQINLVMTRFLASSGGSWYEVYPCPNEDGMAFFREKLKKGAEQQRKTAHFLAELREPLRGELKDLLKRQEKIDAIKKYQAAASVDLTTAVMVINALEKANQ